MTSDTTINPITPQDGNETESATTTAATGATDHQDPGAEPLDEPPISLDSIFDVLQNERRRFVLRYIAAREGPVSVGELSEYVAALENDKPVSELNSQERKRVYVGLYQSHLPKMDDIGFIEYNKPRGSIELGPNAGYAERYLQRAEEATRPWPIYYLGLVGVGFLIVLGGFVLGPLVSTVAIGVFLALTTTLALAHTYSRVRKPTNPSFEPPP